MQTQGSQRSQAKNQGRIQPTKEETATACRDLKKARELGDDSVEDMLFVYCKEVGCTGD